MYNEFFFPTVTKVRVSLNYCGPSPVPVKHLTALMIWCYITKKSELKQRPHILIYRSFNCNKNKHDSHAYRLKDGLNNEARMEANSF